MDNDEEMVYLRLMRDSLWSEKEWRNPNWHKNFRGHCDRKSGRSYYGSTDPKSKNMIAIGEING